MKNLAIIPARGGSKRIPQKNIKPFLGKPILAYSIEAAQSCGLFDEIMVSTDDIEIAELAKSFGASVPFMRSAENASDFSTTVDALLEVLDNYKERGEIFHRACCIYPTAPFASDEKLKQAYEVIVEKDLDSVFPAMRFSYPIQRALKLDDNKRVSMFYPEYQRARSQDLEPAFHDAGQFYWFHVERLFINKKLWAPNSSIIEISQMEGHDIDTLEDWEIAEFKYKSWGQK